MKPDESIYVVGGDLTQFLGKGHPDWDEDGDNPSLEDLLTDAINGAFDETGVDPDAIERGYIGNFAGECFANQGHMGALAVRANEAFDGKPFQRVEGACASGGLAVVNAVNALEVGADIVLAAGAEIQSNVSAREGAGYLARAAHWETERDLDDFTFPAMFARRAKHYKEKFDVENEDFAHVVAKAYSNANKNPYAHMQEVEVTFEEAAETGGDNFCFLKNEELKPHLRQLDCSQVTDGAVATVLATEEGLQQLGIDESDCVEISSYGWTTSALGDVDDYTELSNTKDAATDAYSDAGIHPDDVDVAEVHDCFAVTEFLMYEALGWADAGKGVDLAESGATRIDGDIPVNTGGGLIGFGHPVGATGVKQVLEIYRQMKRKCGDYQISDTPGVGLTANMGGDDRTTVCFAIENR
jgi:acetyl-CoA acyltransferase